MVALVVLIPGSILALGKVVEHAIRQRNALPAQGVPSPATTTAKQVATEARELRRTLRADLADLERREGVV